MLDLGAKEQAVAAARARDDLYFYSRFMMSARRGIKWLRADHHQIICDALMAVFRGEIQRLIINIPPRYGKTELVRNFVAWTLGHFPDSEFILASYSATLATESTSAIRDTVIDPVYQQIFPGVQLSREGMAHWKTTAGGVIFAAGTDGTITGFGAGKKRQGFGGALIVDDAHKPEEARSDVMREKVIRTFQSTVENRLNWPDVTPTIVIGQCVHEVDLPRWLRSGGNGQKWESIILPALREDGTALWPQMHSPDALRRMQLASPYNFSAQYQQSPSAAEGNIFKPDAMPIFSGVPVGTKIVRGWDLGASDKDGDPTCGFKLGKMPDGRFVIIDVRVLMGRPDDVEAAVKNAAASDGPSVECSIPQDPGQAGKAQAAAYVKLLTGHRVHTSLESGDKVTRAEPFAAQVNVGNVGMLKAPWNDALLAEMRVFPNGAHDDQVDAGSRAFNRLNGGGAWAFTST